jgi:hypothetical protein
VYIDWGAGVNGILLVPFPPTLELRVASVQRLNAAQKRRAALNRDGRGGLIMFIPGSASLGRTASIADGSAKNEHSGARCALSLLSCASCARWSAVGLRNHAPPLLEGGPPSNAVGVLLPHFKPHSKDHRSLRDRLS